MKATFSSFCKNNLFSKGKRWDLDWFLWSLLLLLISFPKISHFQIKHTIRAKAVLEVVMLTAREPAAPHSLPAEALGRALGALGRLKWRNNNHQWEKLPSPLLQTTECATKTHIQNNVTLSQMYKKQIELNWTEQNKWVNIKAALPR